MKKLSLALLWTIGLVALAYAGTTLRLQDLPVGWLIVQKMSASQITAASCPGVDCVYYNTTDKFLYTSTGTAPGQVRNTTTGTGLP